MATESLEVTIEGETLTLEIGTVAAPGGGGGVTVHNDLTGRDASSAHPMSAVDGLAAALALLAPLASPAFTGTPTGPTAAPGTSSTQYATTAFVAAAIAALLNSAPGALDTLDELAAALGDDPNFATTVTNALAGKLAKASNLSDLTDAAAARGNLGASTIGGQVFTAADAAAIRTLLSLGAAALLAVGTSAGTVAAGDHTHASLYAALARAINTSGLATGGGDLSADRTITVPAASTSTTEAWTSTADALTPGGLKNAAPPAVVWGTSGDKTGALTDSNVDQLCDNGASARVWNIPANSSVAFSTYTKIPILRLGSGSVTVDAPSGVTLNGVDGGSCTISTQYQGVLLTKTGTDAWVISGDHGTVA